MEYTFVEKRNSMNGGEIDLLVSFIKLARSGSRDDRAYRQHNGYNRTIKFLQLDETHANLPRRVLLLRDASRSSKAGVGRSLKSDNEIFFPGTLPYGGGDCPSRVQYHSD